MLKPAASSLLWLRAALIAGAAAAATPVLAQTVEELTVVGRQGVGPNTRSVSAVVSYRDLDLTTVTGRTVLTQRVRTTAQDLCRQLGEQNMGATGTAASCEQDAINSVSEQQRVAIASAKPHNYAVTAPAPAPVAPAAESQGAPAAAVAPAPTVRSNNPIPDTPENRAAFGGPNSAAGQRTTPKGN